MMPSASPSLRMVLQRLSYSIEYGLVEGLTAFVYSLGFFYIFDLQLAR